MLFFKFSNAYLKNWKKLTSQNQGICHNGAFASFKKGGKIQTGLNCGYDGF